jgi:hypothetical protein
MIAALPIPMLSVSLLMFAGCFWTDPAKVRAMRADGMGPSAIAKALKIGRASVYRALEG